MIENKVGETRAVYAVDLDGYGRPDLLGTAFTCNQVMWYRNPDDPTREPWEKFVIYTSLGPMHGHPVDMYDDGDFDVVMGLRGSDDLEGLG